MSAGTVESTPVTPDGTPAAEDLFALARRAVAAREATLGRRGTFTRSRRLLATGAWRGPRDAVLSYVEASDLAALGGWSAARQAGATTIVGDAATLRQAEGAQLIARLPFRSGESETERLDGLRALAAMGLPLWGVIPTPEGEAYGLDTLRFTALCRLELPAAGGVLHVIADVERLGPRLAQMCFGFGADELLAPIVGERALRLGDNANNPALTRKEAVTLIRGAGLIPAERLANDVVEEVT